MPAPADAGLNPDNWG